MLAFRVGIFRMYIIFIQKIWIGFLLRKHQNLLAKIHQRRKKMLIETTYGLAIIICEVSFGNIEGYRVRLTENSVLPGQIIEFLTKEYTWEYKDK